MQDKLKVALYGDNGHQLHVGDALKQHGCEVVGHAEFSPEGKKGLYEAWPEAQECEALESLLGIPGLDLVVLCSPLRSEQAGHAVQALRAGIHVYAEKPCATQEADLDRILATARDSGRVFHEMAGTVFGHPWYDMRTLVEEGVLGDIQQVLVQKSYGYHDGRPVSETIDGGLIAQNGVHALRFVEQISGHRIDSIEAIDSPIGERRPDSDLRTVSAFMGRLQGGAIFSGVANYCNQSGFGHWGNEMVRIWGTKGMAEAVDSGSRTRLVLGARDEGTIDCSVPTPDFFGSIVAEIRSGTSPLLDPETELHPTRMVLRASEDARKRRKSIS